MTEEELEALCATFEDTMHDDTDTGNETDGDEIHGYMARVKWNTHEDDEPEKPPIQTVAKRVSLNPRHVKRQKELDHLLR